MMRNFKVCSSIIVFVIASIVGAAAIVPVKLSVTMTGKQGGTAAVYVKSMDKMRMEMKTPGVPRMFPGFGSEAVIILDGNVGYALDPRGKRAIKLPGKTVAGAFQQGDLPATKIADPKALIAEMKKKGFKKTSTAKLGSDTCDVYTKKDADKEGTIWVRQSDQHPIKIVSKKKEGTATTTLDWTPTIPDSLFKLPAGFKVEEPGKGKM